MTTGTSATIAFGPLEVRFDDRVLRPRRWTLAQSEWAASLAADCADGAIVELRAGVGHIGLAAAVVAGRNLVQVEVDPVAAGFARENAERAGWAARVDVRCGRIQDVLAPDEQWPLMIADPPYLSTQDCERFPEDPEGAIDGGDDGLELIRACLVAAARHLSPGGPLVLQIGGGDQAGAVRPHADRLGLRSEELRELGPDRAILLLRRSQDPVL